MSITVDQYISYEKERLNKYRNHLDDISGKYNNALAEFSRNNGYEEIYKTKEIEKLESDIINARITAQSLIYDLDRIQNRYRSNLDITQDINNYNNRLNSAKLPIFENITLEFTSQEPEPEEYYDEGTPTGAAAMSTNPKKAESPEYAWYKIYINLNNLLNKDRPEARELANIFLVSPGKAPDSEEYKYIKPGYAEVLNDKYNFTGTNKEIKKDWSGFAFSKYSALSKKASAFPDLQNQIRSYYDPATRQFKKDKLEVNFAKDSNLNYALGHATILTPTIDSNGYFHGILFDKYDFDALYKNYAKDCRLTVANNLFYAIQQSCKDRNFYVLAPISFKW